jgi:hypothetical protein
VIVFGRDGLRGEDAGGVVGEVAAGVGTLEDLLSRGVEGLAHLLGDEEGEVVNVVLEEGGELAHAEGAMLERHGGVGVEGLGGEGDLFARGFFGERIEAAEEFASRGIDRFNGHRCVNVYRVQLLL